LFKLLYKKSARLNYFNLAQIQLTTPIESSCFIYFEFTQKYSLEQKPNSGYSYANSFTKISFYKLNKKYNCWI